METKQNPGIHVRMLGRFEFSDGKRTLTQAEIHSERVTKLAAYLILHSRRACSFREQEKRANRADAQTRICLLIKKILHQRDRRPD